MKRPSIIASISILIVLLQATFCFAGNLEIVNSYPRDGGTGLEPVNCAVKLYFNQNVISEENKQANSACFKILNPDKKSQPITVLYVPKEEGLVEVILNDVLEPDTEYTVAISGDFMATSGDTLGEDQTLTFRTRSTKNDGMASMIMMGVMFVAILVISSRQMKKQAQKDAEAQGKEEKVNPYKVSKETGKSVEEVVGKLEKEKQKKAKKQARMEKGSNGNHKEAEPESIQVDNDNRRVKGPRPISAGGSTYLSGKVAKAAAEEAARQAARAAGTTRPKNQKGKNRGKKK